MVPLLSKPVALALGIALTVVESLQVALVHAPSGVHDAITFAVLVVAGFGVVPVAPAIIRKLLPVHVAAWATALVGVIEILQRSTFHIGLGAHVVLSVVLTLAASVGIVPLTAAHAQLAAARSRRGR